MKQINRAIYLGLCILIMSSLGMLYAGNTIEEIVKLKELRCEYAINPLGIDTHAPKFSWIQNQLTEGKCKVLTRFGLQQAWKISITIK